MTRCSLLLSFSLLLSPLLHGETPALVREFDQIREQRNKAAAAALEPIDRHYRETLELLSRRATQVNNLDLVVRIKEELDSLDAQTAALAARPAVGRKLESFLPRTVWIYPVGPDGTGPKVQFLEGGKVEMDGTNPRGWKVTGKDKVEAGRLGELTFDLARTEFKGTEGRGVRYRK